MTQSGHYNALLLRSALYRITDRSTAAHCGV